MKPLLVLLGSCLISLITIKIFQGRLAWATSARIAMSVMLIFTALGHFTFTQGMSMMLPRAIPYKRKIVYLTGILEIAAAIGLLIPSLCRTTAWWLILFFVLILPANIYAALKHVDYKNGSFHGSGVAYLWFRIPLQVFFIIWTYLSVLVS